jgi:hypothetical protein
VWEVAGTQTAALAFGGLPSPTGSALTATEEYNGSTWASNPTLNTARTLLGAGIQTAALGFGGATDYLNTRLQQQQKNMMVQLGQQLIVLNTAREQLGGAGTKAAALGFGGARPTGM